MPKLNKTGYRLPKTLNDLIEAYNKEENSDLEKLFYLQKINYYLKGTTNPQLISWRNQLGREGLEAHLQVYGIHRDSSELLQSIEFAQAVKRFAEDIVADETSLFAAMSSRDALFSADEVTPATIEAFAKSNLAIFDQYTRDEALQEKVARHANFLALTYAKVDAIQGYVRQYFDEYETSVLGNPDGNNKNFILTVSEGEKLVIRVEDRNSLGKEQRLQSHEVSEYFSEDYATLMVPFDIDGDTEYRPVVVSQLARGGDLESYASTLADKKPEGVVAEAENLFSQLSDFCVKLMDSGHYHPDIKLSNFLVDDGKIVISDRKTLTDKKNPKVMDISSSPAYAAPEYQACLTTDEVGMNMLKARKTTLDMPSYMSYQVGMALKEFMCKSKLIPLDMTEDEGFQKFLEWNSISSLVKNPSNEIRNISILVEELTRSTPEDRLSIQNFNALLKEIHLPSTIFLQKLGACSPSSIVCRQKDAENLQLIRQVLTAEEITPTHKEQLSGIRNLKSLLSRSAIKASLDGYFKQVEERLLAEDLRKSSLGDWFLHKLGIREVPRVTKIKDLDVTTIPIPDAKTRELLVICSDAGYQVSPLQKDLCQVLETLEKRDRKEETEEVAHGDDLHVQIGDATGTMIRLMGDDTGTMVRRDDTGTMVRRDDTGTMVRRDDTGTMRMSDGSVEGRNVDPLAAALASFGEMDASPAVATPVVTDVTSTIARGDKVRFFKITLDDVREDGVEQEEDHEQRLGRK
ncbi:serine/threonine-protein kinase [Legionella nagasakiensis]|uniref:serine/threonine-protein kinase n=1 Tax=Legionella nagasakiensis TaxID=535290 RepID=UPI001054290B|nr:serine/threonine-protein kinase [Legionella nagasakiensis]